MSKCKKSILVSSVVDMELKFVGNNMLQVNEQRRKLKTQI